MIRLLSGDCRDVLATLAAESVQCVVTSPPYYGLRDYGTALWDGGDAACEHLDAFHSSDPVPPSCRQCKKCGRLSRTKWLTTSSVRSECDQCGVSTDYTDVASRGTWITDTVALWKGGHEGERGTARDRLTDICPCGAVRVDRQIGLEATPDEYLATMVGVFREIRRVMRQDATCWVNLGDAYRDKQLQMMPARLALALQEPYYTGQIKKEADRIWLAAIIDGEGCFFIHKRKAGTSAYSSYTRADGTEANYARTADTFGVGLEIANTSKAMIDRVAEIVPGGTFVTQGSEQNDRRKQTIYRWRVGPNEVKRLAQELYPHLVAKQHQARLVFSCPSNGDSGAASHQAMMDLHNGVPTSVDYPAPPSLFEPGFYVRSDIIWGKPNPMPESVTDRCTSAHEHVFMLTKAPRYYFDAAAIAEAAAQPFGAPRLTGQHKADADGFTTNGHGNSSLGTNQGAATRACRNVWMLATHAYPDAHFATFPPELAERCIKAGTSERGCCAVCGKPRERVTEGNGAASGKAYNDHAADLAAGMSQPSPNKKGGSEWRKAQAADPIRTTGWRPGCRCGTTETRPCVVLDPFAGAGTTLLVADRLQRDAVGIELNTAYTELALERCRADAPLFTSFPPAEDPEDERMADLFTDMAAD